MSLAHNYLTNLFVSNSEEMLLSNLSIKNNSVIEADRALLHCGGGVVMSLPFDHVTFINLYISIYREATGATFIQYKPLGLTDFLFQIFCDNKIFQERQMLTFVHKQAN